MTWRRATKARLFAAATMMLPFAACAVLVTHSSHGRPTTVAAQEPPAGRTDETTTTTTGQSPQDSTTTTTDSAAPQDSTTTTMADGSASGTTTSTTEPAAPAPAESSPTTLQAEGIWVVARDGRGLRLVVAGRTYGYSWSPGANRLVYTDASGGLWVVGIDGGSPVRIATLTSVNDPNRSYTPFAMAWSPRGDLIAFADGDTAYVVGADGSGLRRIGAFAAGGLTHGSHGLEWSRDGHRLAYLGGGRQLTVYDVVSGAETVLVAQQLSFAPTWSPDDQRIAFIDDQSRLAVVDATDAQHNSPRTVTGAMDPRWIDWDPTTNHVLVQRFASQPSVLPLSDPTGQLGGGSRSVETVLISIDDGQQSVISTTATDGEWAADGTLASLEPTNDDPHWDHRGVFVQDESGHFVARWGQDQANDYEPSTIAWSPDGKTLLVRAISLCLHC